MTVGRTAAAPAAKQPREFLPTTIEYRAPGADADDPSYARVQFEYAAPAYCGDSSKAGVFPVGSKLSYRSGFGHLSGSRKLTNIKTYTHKVGSAGFDLRSNYTLSYTNSDACSSGSAAPFRELSSVQRTAFALPGQGSEAKDVVLPPTEFTYGKAASYTRSEHYSSPQTVTNLQMPESVDTNALDQMPLATRNLFAPTTSFRTSGQPFFAVPGDPSGNVPGQYTLAWQLSAAQASGESVTRMWLDINGDGREDFLKRRTGEPDLSASGAPTTGAETCMVDVYVNKGGAGFVKNDGFGPLNMSHVMADVPNDGSAVLCSLNRSFSSSAVGFKGDETRPCASVSTWGAPTSWGSMQQVRHGFMDVDGDGRPELISQAIASALCPYESTHDVPAPVFDDPRIDDENEPQDEHWVNEVELGQPNSGNEPVQVTVRQAYWYVYKNTGSGFAATPTKVTVGRPGDGRLMERVASVPEAGFAGSFTAPHADTDGPKSVHGTLTDMNGDGYQDFAVDSNFVMLGRKGGGFAAPIAMPSGPQNGDFAPGRDRGCDSGEACDGGAGRLEQYTGFMKGGVALDINGDGLPDRIDALDEGTKVSYNTGFGMAAADSGGQVMFSESHTDTRRLESFRYKEDQYDWQKYPVVSERYNRNSTVDLDYDGIADVLHYRAGNRAQLFLGGGGAWTKSTAADLPIAENLAGAVRNRYDGSTARSVREIDERGDYRHTYHLKNADINGDGLLDLVEDSNGDGTVSVRYARPILDNSPAHAAPARLLRTVTNGYGATTTVDYGRVPIAGKWVATKVTTETGTVVGVQKSATEYKYRITFRTPNPYGQSKFAGFGEVRALKVGSEDSDADDLTTVSLYSFDPASGDHRGSLTRTVTVLGDEAFTAASGFNAATQTGVMKVVDHTYDVTDLGLRAPGMLLSYPSTVIMPATTITYTCTGASGQTANACVANAPSLTKEIDYTLERRNGALAAVLPQTQQTRFVNGQGKQETRRTSLTHNIAWTASVFNVAPATSTVTSIVDGVTKNHGVTTHTYHDDEFRFLRNTVIDDAAEGIADKVTRFDYYGGSGANRGQLHKKWEPAQVAKYGNTSTAAGFTEFTYDTHGVHVTKTKNPVGHIKRTTVDPVTGTVLRASGPDYVCPDGNDAGTELDPPTACSFDTADNSNLAEITVTIADGLGRPLVTRKHPSGTGTSVITAKASYDDSAFFNNGSEVSYSKTVRVGDDQLGTSTAKLDGLGRTVRTTSPIGQFVDYVYDDAGHLQQLETREADDTDERLRLRMTYDALGRITELDDPENTKPAFLVHAYDGLKHTVTEQTADASPGARSISFSDAAGQVHTVDEQRDVASGSPRFARTSYEYDGLGRTKKMIDADGVVTTMTHSFTGERTAITTTGRTWAYRYDGNGNMTAMTEPVPAGGSEANYTHATEYDDINRVVKETPAPRNLTAAERTEFKIGPKDYVYDQANAALSGTGRYHQIGKLSSTVARDAGGVAVTTVYNAYDAFGNLQITSQRIEALDGIAATDRLQVNYDRDASGLVERVRYRAFQSNGSGVVNGGPIVNFGYGEDGVHTEAGFTVGGKNMTIANTRNTAGMVTHRDVNTKSTAGFASPRTSYDYDKYGRIESVTTRQGISNTSAQRYRIQLDYWGNGEIRTHNEFLGDQPLQGFTYGYDHRHQLTTATQVGGPGYFGNFTYTAAGRMAGANVSTSKAAKRVPTRNVDHIYQTDDPQRLQALRKRGDGTNLAAYTYDAAGNTLTRTLPDGTTVTQTWDGQRLRKVTKPNGEKETYFYDGHARIAAVRHKADGTLAEVRRYFGDQEVIHQPGKTAQYRQHIAIDGDTVARLDGNEANGTIEHYTTTPQGHHALTLDATNASIKRAATYGPFGETLTELTTDPAIPTGKYTKEFNGKEYDQLANLHYYGYRYYDPLALQWTSADPKYRYTPDTGTPRNANLYTYTHNNPIGLTDPDGLEPHDISSHAWQRKSAFGQAGSDGTWTPDYVDRAGVVEMNATNSEASMARRTYSGPGSVTIDLNHVENSVADGATAEMILVTINTPPVAAPEGGTWASKVEIGLVTLQGLFGYGRVNTYTNQNGLTFESPGTGPMPSLMNDDENAGVALRGLIAIAMQRRAVAEDAAAKVTLAKETTAANAGERECQGEVAPACAGGVEDPFEKPVTDANGNIISPFLNPDRQSSQTPSESTNPNNDWRSSREGR